MSQHDFSPNDVATIAAAGWESGGPDGTRWRYLGRGPWLSFDEAFRAWLIAQGVPPLYPAGRRT